MRRFLGGAIGGVSPLSTLRPRRGYGHQLLLWHRAVTLDGRQRSMSVLSSAGVLTAAVRGALTTSQAAQLDHSLRQVLLKGPLPITHLTRKLPDVTVDILEDLDSSLLQYLERSKKFLVRAIPDGRKVVSLAPGEAVTAIKGDARKPVAAVYDVLAQHSYAHVVGGIPFEDIDRKLTAAQRRQIRDFSGGLTALLMSFRHVFDVDERANKVRLVDQRTSVDMAALAAAMKSTTNVEDAASVASTDSITGGIGVPMIAPAAPPPPRGTCAAGNQNAQQRQAEHLLHLLRSCMPRDAFVPLAALLAIPKVLEGAVRLLGMPSRFAQNNQTSEQLRQLTLQLLPLLEALPSTELDCRVFSTAGSEDASLIFLRVVLVDTDAEDAPVAHQEVDVTLSSRFFTNDASLLLNVTAQHYAQVLPPDALNRWVATMTRVSDDVPLGVAPGRGDGPMPLPPIPLDTLNAIFSESPQWASARPAACSGEEGGALGGRLLLLLILERHSHVFEVNWGTYECRVRAEVFAAWVLCRRGQHLSSATKAAAAAAVPLANEPSQTAHHTAALQDTTSKVGIDGEGTHLFALMEQPKLYDVMACLVEVPPLLQRMVTLELHSTPTPLVVHSVAQLVEGMHSFRRRGVAAEGGPPTINSLVSAMSPSEVRSIECVYGSVPMMLRLHPHIFYLRGPDGGPVVPRPLSEDAGQTTLEQGEGHTQSPATVWTLALIGRLHRAAAVPSQYGEKEWSDNVVAQAIVDSLPDDGESCVMWAQHRHYLLREYTNVIPVDILSRTFPISFFHERPHLFEVYEPMMNHRHSFVIGRKGVPAPLGCHPRHCRDLRAAIRQMAIVSVGGISVTECMSNLSTEARTFIKRYGGILAVAEKIPQWFDTQGDNITYIGAMGASTTGSLASVRRIEGSRDNND